MARCAISEDDSGTWLLRSRQSCPPARSGSPGCASAKGQGQCLGPERASTGVFLGGCGEGIREGRFSSPLLAVAKRCPLPTPLASESFKASHQLYNFSPGWKSLQVVVSSFRNWKPVGMNSVDKRKHLKH